MGGRKFWRGAAVLCSAALAAGLLSGCGVIAAVLPHNYGVIPNAPVGFLAATVTVPPELVAGTDAVFSATLVGGVAPYTVVWDFGGGAVPDSPNATGQPGPTSTATVKPLAGDWYAKVTLIDALGLTFTTPEPGVAYHVEP